MITLKGSSGIYEGPTIEEMYTDGIEVNTKFHELNTDKYYYYDGSDWVEIPGGGGGGFVPTEDQLAAMNSGITAEDVEQIDTNKTNILTEQGKTTGMSEGGSNYITVGGIRVYVSATAPTGARTGDMWIGG